MTKQQKLDYVIKVNDKFENAPNHGHNGNNWWYPKPNVIAYKVKMWAFGDIDDLRKYMSARQNEYYDNDSLSRMFDEVVENEARNAIDDIIEMGATNAWFAGRSGGWLEVEYQNDLNIDETSEEDIIENIEHYYKEAQEMEELETKIDNYIKEGKKALEKYLGSDTCYSEIVSYLMSDSEIGDEYKGVIKTFADKLK
jgi:hypothetical protein